MDATASQQPPAGPPPGRSLVAELARPTLVMLGILLALGMLAGPHTWPAWLKIGLAHLLACAFGGLIGATELVARYRDDPAEAIRSRPAMLYILVNAVVAWVAFWLIHSGRVAAPMELLKGHPLLNALLVGGFGGMALFRASVFNVRIRDQTVQIGPAAVLQVILRAADRSCDRERAGPRAEQVRGIMKGVTFELAKITLPQYCYVLMQNISLEERGELDQLVALLEKQTTMSDETKAYNLGLMLMNLVGRDVLGRAVQGLGDRIRGPAPDNPVILGEANALSLAVLPALYEICIALRPAPGTPVPGVPARAEPRSLEALLAIDPRVTEEKARVLIALARLRADFGPETVVRAIGSYRLAHAGGTEVEDPGLEAFRAEPAPPAGG